MILPKNSPLYIGRFAPSPTGPLHLGSLYTALASYLDARQHGGLWLLRIDDLDTPRNADGAIDTILHCLDRYGLHWDNEVYYQSRHIDDYLHAIDCLHDQHRLYRCVCSRKRLTASPNVYSGFCRTAAHPENSEHALRIKTDDETLCFEDRIQGKISENIASQHGDFIIKRKDGIIAYQLAVVIDDHLQEVNQVVRGYDLLDSTTRQIFLHRLLDYPEPVYMHVPIIVDAEGNKLSKQTCARAVDESNPPATLIQLLKWLKQSPPTALEKATTTQILEWAIAHWQPDQLKAVHSVKDSL